MRSELQVNVDAFIALHHMQAFCNKTDCEMCPFYGANCQSVNKQIEQVKDMICEETGITEFPNLDDLRQKYGTMRGEQIFRYTITGFSN